MRVDLQRTSSWIWRAGAAALVAAAVMVPVGGAFLKAQEAAPAAQKAVVLTPVESRIQAGRAMLQAGNLGGAEEAFRMAHELDPKNSEALMGLVEALIAEGKSERALVLLKQESARNSGRLDLHLALGNTAVRAQQYDLAQSEFQTVLDMLDPASAAAGDIHMRMGETYRRMGNMDSAIRQLRLAKSLLPGRIDVVSTLALCLDSAGQWKEAQKEYMEVIQADPNNVVALNNAAYMLSVHGGDPDVALTYAKRAVQLKPELPEVSDTLGTIYLERGMTDAALDIFRQLLKQSPGGAEHMALRLAKNGQRDAVWADLTAALANHHSKQDDQAIVQIMQKLGTR